MTETKKLQRQLREARRRIKVLERELSETHKGLNALSLELEQRVEERTQDLTAQLNQFNRLFNGTGDAIYIHDARGEILEVNRTALTRLGYSREKILSMNLTDIRPKDDDSPIPKPGDKANIFETVHLKKDGTRIPVEVIATDLHYEGKKAVLNVARDVTRRKRAEERKDHLNSVLLSVRNVNQLLVKTTNREELIEGACDTLIETRGFHHVWTILLEEENNLRAAAQAGLNEGFESLVSLFDDGPLPEYLRRVLSNPGIHKTTNPEDSCSGCPLTRCLKLKPT